MSYCGRCGTFYSPQCQQWPACAPAENPFEQKSPTGAWLFAFSAAGITVGLFALAAAISLRLIYG